MTAARRRDLILAAVLLALLATQLAAFRWGVLTPDTIEQYGQALTGTYDDWHPPVTAWLWRLLIRLHKGSAPILLFDVALYWSGIGLIARHRLHHRGWPAAALIIFVAALPIPFGQMGALLKDPLLAALCLLATGLILSKWRRAAILPLALATATRFNALFATVPLLVALLPAAAFTTPIRRILAVAAATASLATSAWLIDDVYLRPRHSQPVYSLITFDLAGIAAHGGRNPFPSLAPADATRLVAQCYTPGLFNPHDTPACDTVGDGLAEYAQRRRLCPTEIWFRAIAAQPLPWLRHRFAHLARNWRVTLDGVPQDAVYAMSEPNPYGLRFTPNPLTRIVVGAAQAMANSPFGRPVTWIVIALILVPLSGRLASRPIIRALAASAILYGGAYALISVAPDLRYNLWTILAAMLATAFALGDLLDRRSATNPSPILPVS